MNKLVQKNQEETWIQCTKMFREVSSTKQVEQKVPFNIRSLEQVLGDVVQSLELHRKETSQEGFIWSDF